VLREARPRGLPGSDGVDRRDAEAVRELVDRARSGERAAFAVLYRAHHAAVWRLASFYLQDAAEDAVSETFVRAWKALPRFKPTKAPFSAWLYAIARNVVADELKRQRRSEPRDTLPDSVTTDDLADRAALAQAIAQLPRDQRRVIEMKYLLGFQNPDVATAIGRSTGAVNAIQWRALKKLRENLS
jgi:RNA polymerase sigma-70 factor, ECF subfamily